MRFLLSALLCFFLAAGSAAAANIRLTVYHTNDIHGWSMPHTQDGRLLGGMAAAAAVIKKAKGPRLLLDEGDWFQGTPEGTLSKGGVLVELFNAMGYDAVAPGNHDFDFGEANLKVLVGTLKMPVLAVNVYRSHDGQRAPYLRPWLIKEVAGVKVGLFGLVTSTAKALNFAENTEGLEFRSETQEARRAVSALRARGATVIIALTHVGFETPEAPAFEGDQTIAAEVEGIDLIVGGHSHTFLKEPLREATHGTLITQAGTALTALGEVTLDIDPLTKKVVSSSARLIDLWQDKTGSDAEVAAIVARQMEETSKVYDVVVATAAAALSRNAAGESSLGDWMTDCLRDWAGVEMAFQNGGGIRADVRAGPVTARTLFEVMPFDNRVVKLRMKGAQILEVLDGGVAARRMLQQSGLDVVYRRGERPGSRIVSAARGGVPLDPAQSYDVAALDFMVKGGDGFSPFDRAEVKQDTKTLMRDVLRACAEKKPLIEAPAPGRLTSKGD